MDSTNPFITINANNVPKNLLSYDGRLGAIFAIWLKNLFFNIITIGLYRAWAKSKLRRYAYASFAIGDDKLEYTGTGGELFKGFIIACIIFAIAGYGLNLAASEIFADEYAKAQKAEDLRDKYADDLSEVTSYFDGFDADACVRLYKAEKCEELYTAHQEIEADNLSNYHFIDVGYNLVLLMLLMFFARFSAARYRLNRTKWRGIRGGIRGASAGGYVFLRIKRLFLNLLTLGFLKGRSDLIANKYILDNAYIGTIKFAFTPEIKSLDKVNFITMLLALPTLGISRAWYRAALLNCKYNSLSLAGMQFSASFSAAKLLWLRSSNLAIVIFTCGFGSAVAIQRAFKFFADNVVVKGNAEHLAAIEQKSGANAIGEGISGDGFSGFDVDFGPI